MSFGTSPSFLFKFKNYTWCIWENLLLSSRVFFYSVLCCCSSADHLQVYLVKFGKIQNMQVENLKHHIIL